MKTIFKSLFVLTTMLTLYACPEDDDGVTNNCTETQILFTEREVVNPATNTSFLLGYTFTSVQANDTNIKVTAVVNDTQTNAIIEVKNYSLFEGLQNLNLNPAGDIHNMGYTFTTYYQPNGQSFYPVEPKGYLQITNYNQNCNTITGTIFIQAYTLSNDLGEIRFSAKFDFENVPLDNQPYQL